MFVQVDNI